MSPGASNFHGFQEQSKKVINGPRPSPLMINKDSHVIRKPSSSTSSSSVLTEMNPKPHHHQQIRKPVIIYTHSPKVIHTKAQDFMSLVQKLTGMPRPGDNDVVSGTATENFRSSSSDESINSIKQEKDGASDNNNEITSSALKRTTAGANIELSFADIPLFTPNSSDFLSPSRWAYKYSDSPFGILGSLISPSGLEFIKELPEY